MPNFRRRCDLEHAIWQVAQYAAVGTADEANTEESAEQEALQRKINAAVREYEDAMEAKEYADLEAAHDA